MRGPLFPLWGVFYLLVGGLPWVRQPPTSSLCSLTPPKGESVQNGNINRVSHWSVGQLFPSDNSPLWGESNVERGAAAGGSPMRRHSGPGRTRMS